MRHVRLLAALLLLAPAMHAQQQRAMGTIPTADAQLSGSLEVTSARARLLSNASVTAYDHTAQIDLDRGGLVQVCATSAFHLLRSGSADALLFALDRGAMELHTTSRPQDAILTPDLRFTLLTPGPLDLRMRVTREGDTCVDNHGAGAPVLQITEGFGSATYRLAPGQHVLFEHGSLREVVDNERSNCGCPTNAAVLTASGNATAVASPQQAAAANPFPVAQSADLAPTTPTVPLPTVSATLSSGTVAAPAVETPVVLTPAPAAVRSTADPGPKPDSPPGARDIGHRIGRFFKRLFGSKS